MARKLRVEFSGACYHVINRGNYRSPLFIQQGAAYSFQRCLFEACQRFQWRLHAFAIMRNHFHLALETPEPNLSEGMKWLQCTWAIRFNRYRAEVGHPFQGRYKAIHVERGAPLARVTTYIHLNPLRGGLTAARTIPEYPWSSLSWFPRRNRPPFFDPSFLQECGGWADTAAGWHGYRQYLLLIAEQGTQSHSLMSEELSRGWAIGSLQFISKLRKELQKLVGSNERVTLYGADRDAHLQARAALWELRIHEVATALEVRLQALPSRKSALEKLQIAAIMRRTTSVSNRWLANRLQMGEPTGIGSLLSRFNRSAEPRTQTFKKALSRFSV